MVDGPFALGLRRPWTVAALLLAAGDALAVRFSSVVVEGEVSGFNRAASGHCYLSLKDAGGAPALVRCALFRRAASLLDFEPRDGMRVEVAGRISLYEPRGELQLVVEAMRRVGSGALYEEFLRLRALLERQGLFDPGRKRRLPAFARRIAVVTSPAAAAWRDVVAAFERRAPQVELLLVPSPVQGGDAPPALAAAVDLAGRLDAVDLVLLVRGGGSIEDLWAFNDERVVRAVAACARPVVTGIGHETDLTLCDLAADLRAPTPTAAAELAAPSAAELMAALDQRERALRLAVLGQLDRHAQRIDAATIRLGPAAATLAAQRQRLLAMTERLGQAVQIAALRRLEDWKVQSERFRRATGAQVQRALARLEADAGRLRALDPRAVLRRGFVWIEDESANPVSSIRGLGVGDMVRAVWTDGEARARIESVEAAAADEDRGIALSPAKPRGQP